MLISLALRIHFWWPARRPCFSPIALSGAIGPTIARSCQSHTSSETSSDPGSDGSDGSGEQDGKEDGKGDEGKWKEMKGGAD